MSTTSAICQHSATYLDVDETKCRTCGQSLTYPRRAPGPQDKKDRARDIRLLAGELRRRDELPVEVVEVSQLLMCHCCREMLAPENFHHRNIPTAAKRQFRSNRCRGCTSFRLRIKRQQDPESTRQRDRARRERYIGAFTPEQRQQEKERRGAAQDTAENRAAQTRRRARKAGIPVMIQTAGRLPTLVKPVCRVAATCPLRSYCTIEGKGVA